MAGRSAADRI